MTMSSKPEIRVHHLPFLVATYLLIGTWLILGTSPWYIPIPILVFGAIMLMLDRVIYVAESDED